MCLLCPFTQQLISKSFDIAAVCGTVSDLLSRKISYNMIVIQDQNLHEGSCEQDLELSKIFDTDVVFGT